LHGDLRGKDIWVFFKKNAGYPGMGWSIFAIDSGLLLRALAWDHGHAATTGAIRGTTSRTMNLLKSATLPGLA
jgi:hypothetical protein